MKTTDIAYEVGFKGETHFDQLFKRLVGLSQKNYREAHARPSVETRSQFQNKQ